MLVMRVRCAELGLRVHWLGRLLLAWDFERTQPRASTVENSHGAQPEEEAAATGLRGRGVEPNC